MDRTPYPETQAFVDKMQSAGLSAPAVEAFCRLYQRYRQGDPGLLPWDELRPPAPGDIVAYGQLQDEGTFRRGCELLEKLVVISLNGGLGTTMKLQRAKSLIPVRQGRSFLEISARQILALREAHRLPVPLLLMNSYRTRDDTLAALAPYRLEVEGLPLDFLQNKSPRIVRETALPLELDDEEPNWAPPGHGDVYLALWQTGLLEQLLERGYRWAFVSNIDNLGSTVDPRILGHLDRSDLQFAMEVADKSPADVKGGTLVRQGERLMLLERSQVAEEHVEEFQDLSVFSVFNTNSLWWRLDAMVERLRAGPLDLPMIVNPKTVEGVEVVQLETAMGAAIGLFERSAGIHVPRSRFAPVKATCDLLAVRSDAYLLDDGSGIRPNPERDPALGPPVVLLDDQFYKGLADFEQRFPHAPSMVACRSLTVEGDLCFGSDVRLEGDVVLRNRSTEQRRVPDGARLSSGTHDF